VAKNSFLFVISPRVLHGPSASFILGKEVEMKFHAFRTTGL